MAQCDIYHIAKHAIKFIGHTHDYDISSVPIDENGITNDLILSLKGLQVSPSQLRNQLFYAPNINSVRRIRVSQPIISNNSFIEA